MRSTLFILSRTPELDPTTYQEILDRLVDQGFDLSRLQLTPQAMV
jgi:apolipoprotein D and lipocalin family protein